MDDEQQANLEASSTEPAPPLPAPKSHKKLWIILGIIVALILAVLAWWYFGSGSVSAPAKPASTTTSSNTPTASATKIQGLQLDTSKNYGNKYADGILPVGDGKYETSGPKEGYVYACSGYAQNLQTDSGGAMTRGPWFTDNNTAYDINKKLHVQGGVMWTADFSVKLENGQRVIVTNDLPKHPTGIFPIASTDPAYQYDRNPNTITGQTFTYSLDASPSYNSTPNCIGGTIGIMLTGVQLNSAFDAGGRDAGAWEIQDSCDGHPQEQGVYHYHTLSSCIKDVSVHTVIGYALDGFPITGPDVGKNNVLTTADLDECHGIVSQITLDGKSVIMYHYVMTEDFPYSISCYRGTPIQPPGLSQQQQSQQQGEIPNRRM